MSVLSLVLSMAVYADVPEKSALGDGGYSLEPGEPVHPGDASAPEPIVGGEDVEPGEWPDTAGIMFGSSRYTYVGCTGVLIAPDLVLTAGHCADGIYSVLLDSTDWDSDEGGIIRAVDVIEYPNSWQTYDISIVVLEHESTVEPRVIANDCILDSIQDGAPVVTVGYGAIDRSGNRYISELQAATTEITDADCSHTDWGCRRSVSPGGELGAGGDGIDSCYGDSGGPLYLPTDKGTYLVGIVSRGWDWVSYACGEGGIWVRPDDAELYAWIEESTGRTLPRPVCGQPPEPTADAIYTEKNVPGATQIVPNNPDGDEGLVYDLVEPPTNGAIQLTQEGALTYTPEHNWVGEESVVVRITDPDEFSADVTIAIKVLSPHDYREAFGGEEGVAVCGCQSGGSSGAFAGLAAILLLVRRRR